VAMFPLDGRTFDVGSFRGASQNYTLTDNDGSFKGAVATDLVYAWDTDGTLGACLFIPDVATSTLSYVNAAPVNAAIEDRTPTNVNVGELSKIYIARSNTAVQETTAVSDVHRATGIYRVAYVTNVNSRFASGPLSLASIIGSAG